MVPAVTQVFPVMNHICCCPTHRREPVSQGDADFEDEFEEEERALQSNGGARAWSLDDGPFKLVLIVNMQLKMGKGKASLGRCLLQQILTFRRVTMWQRC